MSVSLYPSVPLPQSLRGSLRLLGFSGPFGLILSDVLAIVLSLPVFILINSDALPIVI